MLGNVTLLFSRDEREQDYRKAVQEIIEMQTAAHSLELHALRKLRSSMEAIE